MCVARGLSARSSARQVSTMRSIPGNINPKPTNHIQILHTGYAQGDKVGEGGGMEWDAVKNGLRRSVGR